MAAQGNPGLERPDNARFTGKRTRDAWIRPNGTVTSSGRDWLPAEQWAEQTLARPGRRADARKRRVANDQSMPRSKALDNSSRIIREPPSTPRSGCEGIRSCVGGASEATALTRPSDRDNRESKLRARGLWSRQSGKRLLWAGAAPPRQFGMPRDQLRRTIGIAAAQGAATGAPLHWVCGWSRTRRPRRSPPPPNS
jgi:hypothetical protein